MKHQFSAATDGQGSNVVLPVCIVVDESALMCDIGAKQAQAEIEQFYRTIVTYPHLVGLVRLRIIGFADKPEVLIPLQDPATMDRLPKLQSSGSAHFGAAFSFVRNLLDIDVLDLRDQGNRVLQPLIFSYSVGEPNDKYWREAVLQAQSGSWVNLPNVVVLGPSGSNFDVLREIATLDSLGNSESSSFESGAMSRFTWQFATVIEAYEGP